MGKILIPGSFGGGVTSDDVTAGKAQVLQGYKTVTRDSDDEVVEGEIISRGTWVAASEVINASWESNIHTRFEEGYYQNDGQYKPTAKIPYSVLANVIGVDPTKMLQSLTLAGKQGQIKVVDTGANNNRINKSISYGIDDWTDANNPIFYIDLPHGNAYYHRDDGRPHTCIDASVLGNATVDKVVAGSTFTSKNGVAVQGQIADRGEGGVVSFAQGREDWASRIWITFKNGWYHRAPHPQGHESYVYITYEQLKTLFGIDASKMLQGYDIAGVQGTIPRWICTTAGVITALNGEGFVWDDSSGANRGRGIVVRIPDKHFIQDASYVFLGSPNLYPQNVVKNVNINGVTGARNWIDNIGEQMIAQNVEISMLNRNQAISLGNAYANSETVFFGVETVGEDVWDGFVRRDKGNGRYLIGRIPVSKNDGNLLGTFIRNAPVQIEIARDNVGNISLIHHGPNQVLSAVRLNIYIYAHSSISFRL